jgi:hypothetical protein
MVKSEKQCSYLLVLLPADGQRAPHRARTYLHTNFGEANRWNRLTFSPIFKSATATKTVFIHSTLKDNKAFS